MEANAVFVLLVSPEYTIHAELSHKDFDQSPMLLQNIFTNGKIHMLPFLALVDMVQNAANRFNIVLAFFG